jgi:hypothetical protein
VRCAVAATRSSWPLELEELVVDGRRSGLELRLARAADEAEAAPLPLEVGPSANQARALV